MKGFTEMLTSVLIALCGFLVGVWVVPNDAELREALNITQHELTRVAFEYAQQTAEFEKTKKLLKAYQSALENVLVPCAEQSYDAELERWQRRLEQISEVPASTGGT